jgi:hypothetical protein
LPREKPPATTETTGTTRNEENSMPQFVLLLHEKPTDFDDLSPNDIQAIIAEYSAWRDRLVERDVLVDGHKLCDEGGRNLSLAEGSLRVVDGPYAEAKEVLGGLFIVRAESYSAAVEISRDCPHLKYQGRIELRQIDDIHGED